MMIEKVGFLLAYAIVENCELKASAISGIFVSLASSSLLQFGELVILDRPIILLIVFQSNFTSLRNDNDNFL